jgi:uroporphyrinogen decarboxylase
MKNRLVEYILQSPRRIALPLGVYAGLGLTGQSVEEAVTDPRAQMEAQLAWQRRYSAPILQIAMDLTVEAEIYGAQVRFSRDEPPSIDGRVVASRADLSTLIDPKVGHKRTTVFVSAAQWLRDSAPEGEAFVLGSMSGPLTLAAHLYGIAETLELAESDPGLLRELVEIATRFLHRYAWAFAEIGADGVILSEPVAGMVSPEVAAGFSSPYVRRIVAQAQSERFAVVYHNCKARMEHLQAVLAGGAAIYSFGAPMDLLAALDAVDGETVIAGNLDPTDVFLAGEPEIVAARAAELLQATAGRANFTIASGCQLMPATPLPNVDAFYRAVEEFNRGR